MRKALFRVALAVAAGFPATAFAVHSDWTTADEARMRLLLDAPDGGRIAGGIEIEIEPGWHTYWRNPGDNGVPPVFDFSASQNVADVEVLYPAPERYEDESGVSLIYQNDVVFPLVVTPAEAGKPVTVSAEVTFGVCSDVCIPTRATSVVTLPAEPPHDPLAKAQLKRFEPRVPKPAEPGRFEVASVTPEGDTLLIDVRMPESGYTDLFADPPEGWYIGQPRFVSRADGISHYRLPLAGKPKDADVRGQTFQFVAVAGGEAIEQKIEIQ